MINPPLFPVILGSGFTGFATEGGGWLLLFRALAVGMVDFPASFAGGPPLEVPAVTERERERVRERESSCRHRGLGRGKKKPDTVTR